MMNYTLSTYFTSLILVLFSVSSISSFAQNEGRKFRQDGNSAFERNDYQEAELNYRRSLDLEKSYNGTYNLGLSLANQGREEEAAKEFEEAAGQSKSKSEQQNANYNKATALLKANKLQESVKAYIDVLKDNPNDEQAKQNLASALKLIKQQQKQKQQQNSNQDQQNQDQEQKENQEQQQQDQEQQQQQQSGQSDPSDPSDPSEEKKEQQNDSSNQPPEEDKNSEDQQKQMGKDELTDEQAERLLQQSKSQEEKTQRKIRLGQRHQSSSNKDW